MTIIIAEIGENHCGNIDYARKMIKIAKDAGADIVKFQTYNGNKAADSDPEKEWFKKVNLSKEQHVELMNCARNYGIEFLSTPFGVEEADMLFSLGLKSMKIASFHINNLPMLQLINQKAERVFLSTGMSSMQEIERAVNELKDVKDIYLLHCVSEYPLPYGNVNLRVMDTLRNKFPRCNVGYSDHTIGITAPIAAVARGAEVIEKHITLDKNLPGTDHILSADIYELKEMVKQIRLIEDILGVSEKIVTKKEKENQKFMRERFSYK